MYKVEELKFLNDIVLDYVNGEPIRRCEMTTSREDKIKFIDEVCDGFASCMLSIFDKCGVNSYRLTYQGDVVSQWYHDLVMDLVNEENNYMQTHTPYYIKLNDVKRLRENKGYIFDSKVIEDIYYNGFEPEEVLDDIIKAYNKVDEAINNIHSKYKF